VRAKGGHQVAQLAAQLAGILGHARFMA